MFIHIDIHNQEIKKIIRKLSNTRQASTDVCDHDQVV